MNLVKGMEISAPNQALCSDITYIYTEEGFLFLSLMMDMLVHDIVGWVVKDSLDTIGPLEALQMAMRTLPEDASPVAHSDRGCQYGSHAYRALLAAHGIVELAGSVPGDWWILSQETSSRPILPPIRLSQRL